MAGLAFATGTIAAADRLGIPAVSEREKITASSTRIDLTAFQSYVVSVVDPKNGHVLYEIDVQRDLLPTISRE
jgi:hypothetical protein